MEYILENSTDQQFMLLTNHFETDTDAYRIQVFKMMGNNAYMMRNFLAKMLIVDIFGICCAFLIGKYISDRILRPVEAIRSAAERISVEDLSQRISTEGPEDEMKELTITFNSMIDRLDGAFQRQSQFISDASHELRTPLTAINGWGETLLADDHAFVLKIKDTVRAAISEARFAQVVSRMRESTEAMLDTKQLPAIVKLASSSFGITEDESNGVLEHLITGGDFSLYGLANAVTRFSQDVESYDRATKLEEIGYSVMTMSPALFRQMNRTELLAA